MIDRPGSMPGASGWMVYFIQSGKRGPIKIGTTRDVLRRLRLFQTGSAQPLTLIGAIPGGRKLERQIHQHLATDRLDGEWFKPTPDVRRWAQLAAVIDGRHSAEIADWQLLQELRGQFRRRGLLPKGSRKGPARGLG